MMRLDAEKLREFALQRHALYHLDLERHEPMVNTWNVDQLLKDFKQQSET